MADWKSQYLAALKARDELEKADAEIYDRCEDVCLKHSTDADSTGTSLADHNAELRAELRKARDSAKAEAPPSTPPPAPLVSYAFRRQASSPQPSNDTAATAQLRQDFAKAQQDRADLQSQLESLKKEVETISLKSKSDQKKISSLTNSNTQLAMRLRDREEELRGKAKLLVNVQDENATLNLQLNVAEDQAKQMKKENQELVDRWMAKMGKEAEKMNEEGKFK
ncbi:autophagy protein 16, interacts with Atg12p-Atg5p [Neophaeococcomyces mojaviensis]|uniref:Autophagy protein 16, interacts with Atg12p-Atg5p n=1 Tax=Neophaeococcomyces mojaviensis TaxID=3383035 RepID=A0ACC3A2I1_9EURO|nr:autophagy protein 16, interacts with Atg12p-Atg5p [Knufia sp. JES_112]